MLIQLTPCLQCNYKKNCITNSFMLLLYIILEYYMNVEVRYELMSLHLLIFIFFFLLLNLNPWILIYKILSYSSLCRHIKIFWSQHLYYFPIMLKCTFTDLIWKYCTWTHICMRMLKILREKRVKLYHLSSRT